MNMLTVHWANGVRVRHYCSTLVIACPGWSVAVALVLSCETSG